MSFKKTILIIGGFIIACLILLGVIGYLSLHEEKALADHFSEKKNSDIASFSFQGKVLKQDKDRLALEIIENGKPSVISALITSETYCLRMPEPANEQAVTVEVINQMLNNIDSFDCMEIAEQDVLDFQVLRENNTFNITRIYAQ